MLDLEVVQSCSIVAEYISRLPFLNIFYDKIPQVIFANGTVFSAIIVHFYWKFLSGWKSAWVDLADGPQSSASLCTELAVRDFPRHLS
jgi:hypothetical protein